MITHAINIFHFGIMFVPMGIYTFPKRELQTIVPWILLGNIMVPLHWVFLDNMCVLTKLSLYFGDYKGQVSKSQFTDNHLMWCYSPIIRLFRWENDEKKMNKMATVHSFFNILLVWYYCFYIE